MGWGTREELVGLRMLFFGGLSAEDNEKNSIEKFVVYLSSSMGLWVNVSSVILLPTLSCIFFFIAIYIAHPHSPSSLRP